MVLRYEYPQSDIELPTLDQQGPLYVLLNNERIRLHNFLLFGLLCLCRRRCCGFGSLCGSDLTQGYLLLTNSIFHNHFLDVVKLVDDGDTSASVAVAGFQHPHVLPTEHGVPQHLLLLARYLLTGQQCLLVQLLVYLFDRQMLVFLNCAEASLELLESFLHNTFVGEVDYKSDW